MNLLLEGPGWLLKCDTAALCQFPLSLFFFLQQIEFKVGLLRPETQLKITIITIFLCRNNRE